MDNQPSEKDIEAVFHRLRAVASNKVCIHLLNCIIDYMHIVESCTVLV